MGLNINKEDYPEIVDLTVKQFEELRGKSFGTESTQFVGVLTKYPTVTTKDGHKFHSTIVFDNYEEYIEYKSKEV